MRLLSREKIKKIKANFMRRNKREIALITKNGRAGEFVEAVLTMKRW
jgi:hypothetical protein